MNDFQENKILGYIKLYRSLKNKAWYKKSEHVHLWIHLLLKANHEGKEVIFHGETIHLNPGEFITGRKKLAEDTGINESKVERLLTFFEKKERQIEQRTDHQRRIITILSWDDYQGSEQRVNNDRTTSEQRVNTNNNEKNVKNDKEVPFVSSKKQKKLPSKNGKLKKEFAEDSYELMTAKAYWEFQAENNYPPENYKFMREANLQEWASEIEKLKRIDGKSEDTIDGVLEFALNDVFWAENLRALSVIRKKNKEHITKFEMIEQRWRNSNG